MLLTWSVNQIVFDLLDRWGGDDVMTGPQFRQAELHSEGFTEGAKLDDRTEPQF